MFLAKILWTFFHSKQYLGAKALAVVDTAGTGYAAEGIVAFLLIVWIIAHAPAKKYLKNDAAAHVSSEIWHVHIYIVILKVLIDPADEQT